MRPAAWASSWCWASSSSGCCPATRPARSVAAGSRTEEQLEAFRATYGLDQPLPQQFFTYLKNTVQGDLGVSLRYRVPVSDLILDRLWPTLLLVGIATLLATSSASTSG